MNILAIDHGNKNIGLAWCQEALGVVLPYGIINNSEWKEKLPKLLKEEGINKIIMGLPLGPSAEENKNTKRVRDFVEKLKEYTDLPIEFIDERYSSQQADKMEGGAASRDEKAAMVILQSYMDKK